MVPNSNEDVQWGRSQIAMMVIMEVGSQCFDGFCENKFGLAQSGPFKIWMWGKGNKKICNNVMSYLFLKHLTKRSSHHILIKVRWLKRAFIVGTGFCRRKQQHTCHLINLDGGVDCSRLFDVCHLPDTSHGVQHICQAVAGLLPAGLAVHVSLQHSDKLLLMGRKMG